jgi:hypothetical protein
MRAAQSAARAGQHVQDHLAVAGSRKPDAAAQEFQPQLWRVNQVAVVGDGERAVERLDYVGLGVAQLGRAGGGITRMADGDMAEQEAQVVLVEDLRDQPHPLVDVRHAPVAGDDAGGFLPAMLQGVKAKKGVACGFDPRRKDAKNAAFFVELIF